MSNSTISRFDNETVIPFVLFCTGNDGFSKSNTFFLNIQNLNSVAGKVVNKSSGLPVTNAEIFYKNNIKTYSVTADQNGNYNISGLKNNSYQLWANASGFLNSALTNIICPPGNSNLIFELGNSVLSYAPWEFNIVLTQGLSIIEYLAVSNIGNVNLTFSFSESNTAALSTGFDSSGEYKWIDSDSPDCPSLDWEDITSDGTKIYLSSDNSTENIPLLHDFPFYSQNVTGMNISVNGVVMFNEQYKRLATIDYAFPNTMNKPSKNCIAIFWNNFYPNLGSDFYYKTTDEKTVISYGNITRGTHLGADRVSFQIILYPNGDFKMQYLNIAPQLGNLYTVGWQGEDGTKYKTLSHDEDYLKSNFVVYVERQNKWFEPNVDYGKISPGNVMNIPVTFDSSRLDAGIHHGELKISSDGGNATVPITFTVIPEPGYLLFIIYQLLFIIRKFNSKN